MSNDPETPEMQQYRRDLAQYERRCREIRDASLAYYLRQSDEAPPPMPRPPIDPRNRAEAERKARLDRDLGVFLGIQRR